MDIIIIGIIVVLLGIGLKETKKHMKGQGGCCGGGSTPVKVEEKHLQRVIGTKTVIVDGMTCEHCKGWVENAINAMDGASAKVNLKTREVIVSMDHEISDDEIRAAIKKAGYRVIEIKG